MSLRLSQYIGDLIPELHVNGSFGESETALISNSAFAIALAILT